MGNFSELIREFGRSTGAGDIGLGEGEVRRMVIDGDLTLDLELGAQGEVLLVAATMLSGGETFATAVLPLAMQMNLDLTRSGGAFFAYDAADDHLLLIRRFEDRAMRYSDFEPALMAMIAYAQDCRIRLAEAVGEDAFDEELIEVDDEDDDIPSGEPRQASLGTVGQTPDEQVVFRL